MFLGQLNEQVEPALGHELARTAHAVPAGACRPSCSASTRRRSSTWSTPRCTSCVAIVRGRKVGLMAASLAGIRPRARADRDGDRAARRRPRAAYRHLAAARAGTDRGRSGLSWPRAASRRWVDPDRGALFAACWRADGFARLLQGPVPGGRALRRRCSARLSDEIPSERFGEYLILLLCLTLGMSLLAAAQNLLMIYLALELVSLPSYVLAGFRRGDRQSERGRAEVRHLRRAQRRD